MKQTKLDGYRPNYPKKLVKGAVLTAAAMLAIGSATACKAILPEVHTDGLVPIAEPTEEPQLEGYVAPEETPLPDEELVLSGDVMISPEVP